MLWKLLPIVTDGVNLLLNVLRSAGGPKSKSNTACGINALIVSI